MGTKDCISNIIITKSLHAVYCSQEYGAVAHAPVLYNLSCTEQSRFAIHDYTFSISQSTAECDSMLGNECYPHSDCTEGAIRLVDGTSILDGRVEICVNGFWGVLPGPNYFFIHPNFLLLSLAWQPEFVDNLDFRWNVS